MTIPNRTVDIPTKPALRRGDVPADREERRAWIKFQLELRGISLADIARAEGVTVSAVRMALRNPNRYLEEAIAARLGLTARDLFPEWHDPAGNRLRRSRPPNRITRPVPGNAQCEEAA